MSDAKKPPASTFGRDALKKLSRRVVLNRRWPADLGGGKALVSPDVSFRYWYASIGEMGSDLFAAAKLLITPGDHVWDLGMNIGLFSFTAAYLTGERGVVTGIEADTWLTDLTRRTKKRREDWNRVRILPVAIAAKPGIVEFNIARLGRAANFVGDGFSVAGGSREKHHVVSVSLDWLLDHIEAPSVIKIDIEGMEVEAFRGGERLLRDIRPRMYIEVDKPRRAEVTTILAAQSYRFFEMHMDPQGTTLAELPAVGWNTIALPEEQVAKFGHLVRPAKK